MSRRARLFSEFIDESESKSSVTGRASANMSSIQDDIAKRRKTSGLNSRFDRMVQTMNATHRSPVKSARDRTRSIGSSTSGGGSSIPRTPIDEYNSLHHEAKIGPDFSVIKMGTLALGKGRPRRHTDTFAWDQGSSSDIALPPPPRPAPLPAWLANTFSTLIPQHPLRLLLPRRTESNPSPPSPPSDPMVEDDNPFSFCAPDHPIDVPPDSPRSPLAEVVNSVSTYTAPAPRPCAGLPYRPSSLPDSPQFENVIPFSVPGPGSFVSRSDVSATCSIPLLHCPQPSYIEFDSPLLRQSPIPITTNDEAKDAYSSDDPAPFYQDHEESATDDSASDPFPMQSVYADLFSTPGPAYCAPQPVYFDSPAEDPSDSDPLQSAYELDYDSLDFQWAPFIQKCKVDTLALKPFVVSQSADDDYYYEVRVDPEVEDDEEGPLYASVNLDSAQHERALSPNPFSFSVPFDDVPTATPLETDESKAKTPTTPERPTPQFFAPAPGIFLSPLRDNEQSQSPEKNQPVADSCSQDPIEDWDD